MFCDKNKYIWKETENDMVMPLSGISRQYAELEKKDIKNFVSSKELDDIGASFVQTNISKLESKDVIEKGSLQRFKDKSVVYSSHLGMYV